MANEERICGYMDGYAMNFNPEDEGTTVLQNDAIQPPHYMAQQPRKP